MWQTDRHRPMASTADAWHRTVKTESKPSKWTFSGKWAGCCCSSCVVQHEYDINKMQNKLRRQRKLALMHSTYFSQCPCHRTHYFLLIRKTTNRWCQQFTSNLQRSKDQYLTPSKNVNIPTFWQAKLLRAWLGWCWVWSWWRGRWTHACQLWDVDTWSWIKLSVSIHHLIRRQIHVWHHFVGLVRLPETIVCIKLFLTIYCFIRNRYRRWFTVCLIAASPMTLTDLQGHSPISSILNRDFYEFQLCMNARQHIS